MTTPKLKSVAVLIGYRADGKCVYSEVLDLSDYYDGEHVWDHSASVKRIKMTRLKGYLFNDRGEIQKEFENKYDKSGVLIPDD
jgi:hypothetical protein